MPPEAPTSPSAAPPVPAQTKTIKEDDDSSAGSMTLLLTQQATTGKQADQRLPLPSLPRPRKRLVARTSPSSTASQCTTWVLTLLAAAAVMAAVAAAAMAMAARTEIFRLRAEVDNVRARLAYYETLQDIDRMLAPGMEPMQDDEEDVVWDQAGQTIDDLSPSYPEENEFEFAADVKGSSSSPRHSRRHIPTVSGSYESSDNGWRPAKPEKRLKLYETLASASATSSSQPAEAPMEVPDKAFPARPEAPYHHRSSVSRLVAAMAAPPAPPAPPVPTSSTTDKVVVARRSRVMEHQNRNDASWRQRNQMHIQHHLQRQLNSSTSKPAALLMEVRKEKKTKASFR